MKRSLRSSLVSILILSAALVVYLNSEMFIPGNKDYKDSSVIDQRIRGFNGDKRAIEGYLRRCLQDGMFPRPYRGHLLAQGTRYRVAAPWIDQTLMDSLYADGSAYESEDLFWYLVSITKENVYPSHALLSALKERVHWRSKLGAKLETKLIASVLLLEERSLLDIIEDNMASLLPNKGDSSSKRRLLVGFLSLLILRGKNQEMKREYKFIEYCSNSPDPLVRQMVTFLMKEGG